MARKQSRFRQPAVYNATPPTLTDGDDSALSVDVNQSLRVTSGGSGATADQVQGNVASAATDAGNPVKVGGVNTTTLPTFANGQRGDLQIGTRGALYTTLMVNNSTTPVALAVSNADGVAAGSVGSRFETAALGYNFNGTTFDRARGNVDTAALISAAGATTSQTSADQTNYNAKGVKVVLDMTVVGSGSVTLTIQGKDAASGKYYTLLAGAAVTTNSTNVYTVFPGSTATANVSANDLLPRVWRVITTANNANATTYTVGASVVV